MRNDAEETEKRVQYIRQAAKFIVIGVNERGNQPCQPICASTNRHT